MNLKPQNLKDKDLLETKKGASEGSEETVSERNLLVHAKSSKAGNPDVDEIGARQRQRLSAAPYVAKFSELLNGLT